ncbi:MAG: class I SAM-dependent methyltransferase [Thermoanaerobaculia bacterium]|nr:class I SAM-dependent methyltransferase [Thermoanaerobaculia bacterium]
MARLQLDGANSVVAVCTTCGTGRCDPMPGPDEIASFYPPAYYGAGGQKFTGPMERVVRLMTSRQARRLSADLRPLGDRLRVLDIGCGRGDLVGSFSALGFDAHGTEIAPPPDGEFPGTLHAVGDLAEAGFDEESFDLVVLWHVLEHLADPRGTIEEIHRILAPEGRLAIAVPNFSGWQARWAGPSWFHLDLPRHLFQFSRRGLETLLRSNGFDVEREDYFSLRQNPFGWVQSALNRINLLPRNGLYDLLQRGETRPGERLGWTRRLMLLSLAALLTPIAVGLSVVAGFAEQGGAMTMVARRGSSAAASRLE